MSSSSSSSTIYFDESIFVDGRTITKYKSINVTNKADRYLATRLNLNVVDVMTNDAETTTNTSIVKDDLVINLNPKLPSKGINIYTMDISNKIPQQLEPYNQIVVYDHFNDDDMNITMMKSKVPIYIGEHVEGNVYDVNVELTALESAIMLKYHAINGIVFITRNLYNLVLLEFVDYRRWFKYDDRLVIQTQTGELIRDGITINIPNLQLSTYAIELA